MALLLNALKERKGTTIVNVVYENELKMNKRGNPYHGRVNKVVESRMQFNYSYENAVNNRIGDGTKFVSDKLPWGEWETPNKVIVHKEETYIRFYEIEGQKSKVEYLVDGRPATQEEYEEFSQFIPSKKDNYSEKQAEHGLIEHQVRPMVVRYGSIKRLTMDKVVYEM